MGRSRSRRNPTARPYRTLFTLSFLSGAGTFLGAVPQMIVGILLFIAGLSLKNQADRGGTRGLRYYGGVAIMILGCTLGLGMGSNVLFSELFNE